VLIWFGLDTAYFGTRHLRHNRMKFKIVVFISFIFLSIAKTAFGFCPGMILDMHLWIPTSIIISVFFKVIVISYFLKKANGINAMKFRILLYMINALYVLFFFVVGIYNSNYFLTLLSVLYVITEPILISIALKPRHDNASVKKIGTVFPILAKSYIIFIAGNLIFFVSMFGTGVIFKIYGATLVQKIFDS
jgi:hypothetical protein